MTTKLEAPAQEPRNVVGGGTASLAGVSRAFGAVRALDGLDLDVGAGEIVAVVGPSV
jgi:ABC-type transporter Mla maintaining outer membrane lipid asymmetry ATPase subunit MlaF